MHDQYFNRNVIEYIGHNENHQAKFIKNQKIK